MNYRKLIFLCFVSLAVFVSFALAQEAPCGLTMTCAPVNSCPAVAPYLCNNGSCTNDPNLCNQSWGEGYSGSVSGGSSGSSSGTQQSVNSFQNSCPAGADYICSDGTYETLGPGESIVGLKCAGTVHVCGGDPVVPSGDLLSQKCTGVFAWNKAAAENCAKLAEEQGAALGYDVDCSIRVNSTPEVKDFTPTGRITYEGYNAECTVNGTSGFSAETLVGYSDNRPGVEVPWLLGYGQPPVFGAGYNINAGWGTTLNCSLHIEQGGNPLTGPCASGGGAGGGAGRSTSLPPACRSTATCAAPARSATPLVTLRPTPPTYTPPPPPGPSLGQPSAVDNWYYRDPYVSDTDGASEPLDSSGCTGYETTPSCHPEWARPGSRCSASNMTGACRPVRVNPYAAADVTRRAEAEGKQRGFTTACSARYVPYRPNIDPDTGLNYFYTTECTLNGTSRVEAEAMINATTTWWAQINAVSGSGGSGGVIGASGVGGSPIVVAESSAIAGVSAAGFSGASSRQSFSVAPRQLQLQSEPQPLCRLTATCDSSISRTFFPVSDLTFSSNALGLMRVNDPWNIEITGLDPGEIIYATGGKKENDKVPADKTPYTANDSGVFSLSGVHAPDVVGDWQLVWTRADNTVLGTLSFSVTNESANSETLEPGYSANIGVYHWGIPSDSSSLVSSGVDFATDKGFRIIRLALSPRSSIDYGASASCDSGLSLRELVLLNGFKEALGNSRVNTFILTTYDGATFSDCSTKKYLNPSFYTAANTAAVVEEYYDLTMYLYETYKNTGKKFILSNWEGDNDLYCGKAYSYATDRSFREDCDENYESIYNGNTGVDESIEGMKSWLSARDLGIRNARSLALARGVTGVTVSSAGELSIVKVLRDNGYKSVLYDVLPKVSFDYVSYSSYESINNSNPGATLALDLNTIKNVTGKNDIIVGEFGYSIDEVGALAQNYLEEVAQTVSSSGAVYGIIWQLFDQPGSRFGLFTSEGDASLFNAFKFIPETDTGTNK